MEPVIVNTLLNVIGLILTSLIGVFGIWLGQRMARLNTSQIALTTKTKEIEEVVKVIRVDVDGKLKQILELTERASRAEGRGEARDERRREDIDALAAATLNAVPQAVIAAVPQIIASAEVVPTKAGDVVKVLVDGVLPE